MVAKLPKPPKKPDNERDSDALGKIWRIIVGIIALIIFVWLVMLLVRMFTNAVSPSYSFFGPPVYSFF